MVGKGVWTFRMLSSGGPGRCMDRNAAWFREVGHPRDPPLIGSRYDGSTSGASSRKSSLTQARNRAASASARDASSGDTVTSGSMP